MTGQRTLAVVALLAGSVLCVATVEIRTYETGDAYSRFLVWKEPDPGMGAAGIRDRLWRC